MDIALGLQAAPLSVSLPDPGGQFASEAHRRVLAHLPAPTDKYAYTIAQLNARLGTDMHGSDLALNAGLLDVLDELTADGLAEMRANPNGTILSVWRCAPKGWNLLTGEAVESVTEPINQPLSGSTPLEV